MSRDPVPSTRALVVLAAYKWIGFVVAWRLVGLFIRTRMDLGWAVGVGWFLAYLDVVQKYRKPEWQAAVAPEHAAGLGLFGVLFGLGDILFSPMIERPLGWVRVGLFLVLMVPAAWVLVLAVRQVRDGAYERAGRQVVCRR